MNLLNIVNYKFAEVRNKGKSGLVYQLVAFFACICSILVVEVEKIDTLFIICCIYRASVKLGYEVRLDLLSICSVLNLEDAILRLELHLSETPFRSLIIRSIHIALASDHLFVCVDV